MEFVTLGFLSRLVQSLDKDDLHQPIGKFYASDVLGKYVACDNSKGQAEIEFFEDKSSAIYWLETTGVKPNE